jgi:conjugal transfer pilus assembly protein TraF
MIRLILILALTMIASLATAQDGILNYPSVWQCDANKPNWYCDQTEPEEKAVRPEAITAPASKPMPLSADQIKTAEQLRIELKRREDIAVMSPTDSNIKNYLALWQMTQDKGAVFADSWRRVVWQNPELDYSLKRPTNNTAIKTYDDQRGKNEDDHLRALAKEHGLIFFYRSDCPYCHAMAPTIKMLGEKYGIDVLAVSVDDAPLLPEFPAFSDGRARAQAWGVERVPALFIGSKATGDHAAIGFGQMAFTDIVDRIFVLTNSKPGENF